MTDSLRFHLFGPFEVFRNGQLITNQEWRSQQTRAVCKVLLAHGGQVVTSSQLIEILWPEDEPQAARSRLHVRISQLRRTLGGDKALVQTVDGGYLFNLQPGCWLDVNAFQVALDQAAQQQELGPQRPAIQAYEQARRLYRGDFLAEDRYADWTFPPREFYRERFLTLLTELGECYAQQGRYRLAIARLQEALGHDPVRESLYVRLMLYHYYAGERPQALRVYERCRMLLAQELEVPPLEATARLAEQIRAGTLWANDRAPRYPPPIYEGRLFEVPYALSEMPFVGRAREYAWLVEHCQARDTRLLLIAGEAGVGKSRLVSALTGYLRSQGWQVLGASVSEGERSPFGPLARALEPWLLPDNLARLSPATLAALLALFPQIGDRAADLPELPDLSPQAARQRLHRALLALAEAMADRPTLLMLDDAQRLDAATVELLARLAGVCKVLLSWRSEEAPVGSALSQALGQAGASRSAARLELEPLEAGAVRELIRQMAGGELPGLAEEIYTLTSGNPLYVVALLQHMFEAGRLYVEPGGGWSLTGEPDFSLPPTVRAIIEARLQRLDRAQRRVFDLAAVLGGALDFSLLQQVSQQPEEALLAVLDRLIDAALVSEPRRQGRSEFAITHDRYMEVAYDSLPAVRRRQIHRRAAEAIEQLHAADLAAFYPTLAHHYGGAAVPEREGFYAALAGEQAARQFASDSALRWLNRALELTPSGEAQARARLLLAREGVYDLQGDRPRQQEDLAALAALAGSLDVRQQAEIALRQAAYDWIVGEDGAAGARLEQAINLAQAAGAPDLEAASLLLRGRAGQDQARARQDLERALALAQEGQLPALAGDITRCLGNACFWQHNYVESEGYFEKALAIHREVGDLRGELSALNNLGFQRQLLGALQTAREDYRQALEIGRQVGDRLAEGVLLANLGELASQLGDFPAARDWLEQALAIRRQVANEEGVAVVLRRLGDVHRQQGLFDRAHELYQQALEISSLLAHSGIQGDTLDSLGRLQCELGDYTCAQAYFEQACQVLPEPESPGSIRLLASRSWLHYLRGENGAALGFGQQALALSDSLPQVQAEALTSVGQALAGLGRCQEAGESLVRALELRGRLGQPHLAVEPLAGLADLARRQGDQKQSLAHAEAVLETLARGPLGGPLQPARVYLACWQVMRAGGDGRAGEVLHSAYGLLQTCSADIREPALRQQYLKAVSANRQILQHFQAEQ